MIDLGRNNKLLQEQDNIHIREQDHIGINNLTNLMRFFVHFSEVWHIIIIMANAFKGKKNILYRFTFNAGARGRPDR